MGISYQSNVKNLIKKYNNILNKVYFFIYCFSVAISCPQPWVLLFVIIVNNNVTDCMEVTVITKHAEKRLFLSSINIVHVLLL